MAGNASPSQPTRLAITLSAAMTSIHVEREHCDTHTAHKATSSVVTTRQVDRPDRRPVEELHRSAVVLQTSSAPAIQRLACYNSSRVARRFLKPTHGAMRVYEVFTIRSGALTTVTYGMLRCRSGCMGATTAIPNSSRVIDVEIGRIAVLVNRVNSLRLPATVGALRCSCGYWCEPHTWPCRLHSTPCTSACA